MQEITAEIVKSSEATEEGKATHIHFNFWKIWIFPKN